MSQLSCLGCGQVYPVPQGLAPTTPFTCQKCGYASTLGALWQAAQQAQQSAQQQQGHLEGMQQLPGHAPQAPDRPLAQMPVVVPSGDPSGLDLAEDGAVPQAPPPQAQPPAPAQGGGHAVIQPNQGTTDQYGNPLPPIDVVCPKCKAQSQVAPDTSMGDPFRCQGCGHQDQLGNILLNLDADKSPGQKAKPSASADFYEDVPEELRHATPADELREKALKKDPRPAAIAAALGILMLIGIPLFSGGDEPIDPRLAREGIEQNSGSASKFIGFGVVVLVVAAGLFVILKPQEEEDEDEEEEEDEEEDEGEE